MDLEIILQNNIVNETRHANYKHVCDLSDKYKAFITNQPRIRKDKTGKMVESYPLNDYLRQFVRREDADLFEQRKNITKHYAPSICASIMKPFNKVVRSNRVTKLIDNNDANKVTEIETVLEKFYGESGNNGVDQYLNERFKILTFTDPNAWMNISFNNFDAKKEKPQTYPLEYSCEQVVNFETKNDQTQWVIVHLKQTYIDKKDSEKETDRYLIYGPNTSIEYILKPEDIKESLKSDSTWVNKKNNKTYFVNSYSHLSKQVPLMRVGYVKDIATDDATYVNPFHYEALPLLEQFVKVSSELQLSITLHTFPKQVSYVSVCEAKGCNSGVLSDGVSECVSCKGSGKKVHTTSADVMEIPMPKRPEDMVDVSNISAYVEFPGGVMEFLDNYVEKMEKKILRMMFNSESIMQTDFKTATEASFDMDSVYDTLHPFGDKYSEIWMFFTKLTVLYLSYEEDTVVWHKFPSDLKLKTLNQLLSDLKSANDSKAPSYIRESINNDILDIIYADDQSELSKLKIKNRHFPFPGKSDDEINLIILNNNTTKFKQVLYSNFDNIFDEIESKNDKFYNISFAKQKEIIKTEVDLLIKEIEGEDPVLTLTA